MGKHNKYYKDCGSYYEIDRKYCHKRSRKSIIGPTGPTGPTGPSGAAGSIGPTGPSLINVINFFERVNLTGGAALPNVNFGPIIYGGLELGTLSGYNNITGQFVPPANGIYSITASLGYTTTDISGSYRKIRMIILGTNSRIYEALNPPNAGTDGLFVTAILYLKTSNIVSIFFIHDGISTISIIPGNYTKLIVTKLQ